MLACHVSLRAPRRTITTELLESATAVDATATGNLVLATLVDDPANVIDVLDAYLGEIMVEAASASDTVDSGMAFGVNVVESASASDLPTGAIATVTYTTWNPSDKGPDIALSGGNL